MRSTRFGVGGAVAFVVIVALLATLRLTSVPPTPPAARPLGEPAPPSGAPGQPQQRPTDAVGPALDGPVERRGGFVRSLPGTPGAYAAVGGFAIIARDGNGTHVTIEITEVPPSTRLAAALHTDQCARGGGDVYRFAPGGADSIDERLTVVITSDADGVATVEMSDPRQAAPDARTLLVTLADDPGTAVACSDLIIPE